MLVSRDERRKEEGKVERKEEGRSNGETRAALTEGKRVRLEERTYISDARNPEGLGGTENPESV